MRKWHERLPVPVFDCPYSFFHGRIAPVITLFADEMLIDPFGRMALLAGRLLVFGENIFDEREIRPDLALLPRFCLSISGRGGVGYNLLKGSEMNAVFPAYQAFALAIRDNSAANVSPHLHVCVHPFLPPAPVSEQMGT